MREVQEERTILVLSNELGRFPGIPTSDCRLVDRPLDDLLVAHKRYVPPLGLGMGPIDGRPRHNTVHIVAVRDAIVLVEAVLAGKILWQVSKMPFSDAGRCISLRLERLSDRDFIGGKATGGVWKQHAPLIAAHSTSDG